MTPNFDALIYEISQQLKSNAADKIQNLRHRNPVAAQRAEKFAPKYINDARKKGTLLNLIDEHDHEKEYTVVVNSLDDSTTDGAIIFNVHSINLTGGQYDGLLSEMKLNYHYNSTFNYISLSDGGTDTITCILNSRRDAENLAKLIRIYTNETVAWKSMTFIN